MSDSEDDIVLSKRLKSAVKPETSDDDTPLGRMSQGSKVTDDTSVSDYDSDEGISTTARKTKPIKNGAKRKADSETPEPKVKKAKKEKRTKVDVYDTPKTEKKTKTKTKTAKKVVKEETPREETPLKDENDEDEGYKWWENQADDDSIKWETLEHNGVIFPPEYEPLPSHVKFVYDGKPIDLPVEAEEVAGFFGAMLESDHVKNPVFQKNFFEDFQRVLRNAGGCGVEVTDFNKCDFRQMYNYYDRQREEKKMMTAAEKKLLKQEKQELEAPYKTCLLNGRKEEVGNFRIEPPGLFRGRGAHPKTGKLKHRVRPEDVTLNLGKDAKVPEPPAGHHWNEVRHDNTVSWLAMWKENIAGAVKYVRFSANSSLKGMSDYKKFEKARELKNHIDRIRTDYNVMLKSNLMMERQIATATYLIDVFALRAGGDKTEDEADTVGCCNLRYEHITLRPPSTVVFDFLGKDSVRFYQEVNVEPQIFKNLKLFKKQPKTIGDALFDRIDPSVLNKHFQKYMPGLTAKVFRTYNASKTMQDQLDLIPNEGTANEKVVKFNAANRTVAILCNHQRSVSKGHETSMQKINDKLKEMLWQKIRLKRMMLQLDKKLLKKNPKFFEELSDLAKEDEATIHELVIEREREKYEKKFKRENEKKKENNEEPLPESQLKEWMGKVDELKKQYANELKSGNPEVPSTATIEKLEQQIEKLDQRIANTTLQMKDKEDNSQVALSTSKINYIDPRLSVVFCKKWDVPIEKIFTKTLRDKFKWAIESVDEDWRF